MKNPKFDPKTVTLAERSPKFALGKKTATLPSVDRAAVMDPIPEPVYDKLNLLLLSTLQPTRQRRVEKEIQSVTSQAVAPILEDMVGDLLRPCPRTVISNEPVEARFPWLMELARL
jgi:hypothetical protein